MRKIFATWIWLASTFFAIAATVAIVPIVAAASDAHPAHHAKHNMVLFGESEIFASHIAYKVPHNYQVILKVQLDANTKAAYLRERTANPQDQFIFLLDEMDIKDISSQKSISGTFIRVDSSDKRTPFAEGVVLKSDSFSVLFFDELPLSLEQQSKSH